MAQQNALYEFVDNRLSTVNNSFMNFFNIANSGDLNSAYRGRTIWTKYKTNELVKPAEELLIEVPAARSALFYYISNLVHENVHLYFCEKERKENSGKLVDYTNLELAVRALIAKLSDLRVAFIQTSAFSLNLLTWLFELFSDLSRQNHNRPYFNHQRPSPQIMLKSFQQIPCIADLLELLKSNFTSLLNSLPEKAIHAFVTAHKTLLNNFDWITIHITNSFPPDTVSQLVKTGASEFKAFCNDIFTQQNTKRSAQLQEEYADKLRLFCDIFQYMERNNRIDLRNCFFLIIEQYIQTGENLTEFIFLIKLALTSPEIMLQFSNELLQLIIDPQIVKQIPVLCNDISFQIAVSHPVQIQNFFAKIFERASTDSILAFVYFISPLIHADSNHL